MHALSYYCLRHARTVLFFFSFLEDITHPRLVDILDRHAAKLWLLFYHWCVVINSMREMNVFTEFTRKVNGEYLSAQFQIYPGMMMHPKLFSDGGGMLEKWHVGKWHGSHYLVGNSDITRAVFTTFGGSLFSNWMMSLAPSPPGGWMIRTERKKNKNWLRWIAIVCD